MEEKELVFDQEKFLLKQQILQQEKKIGELTCSKNEIDRELIHRTKENKNLLDQLSNNMIDKETGNLNIKLSQNKLDLELADKNNRILIIEKTLSDYEETIQKQKENEKYIIVSLKPFYLFFFLPYLNLP